MRMAIEVLSNEDFPSLLREIPDPPRQLFAKGNTGLCSLREQQFLCVVGSRKCTAYGRQVVEHLLEGLRGYPVVIVSGLALGIDALAHKAALEAGLKTIAIPGSGLNDNVLYPYSHLQLARQIIEADGLLLSEFESDQKAAPWTFPQRNRVMAGISHATLVIEAEEKSGTLITARLATEYNRELLVVPGSIFSTNSRGVHQFLNLGATPVTSAQDILQALHVDIVTSETAVTEHPVSSDEQKVLDLLSEPLPKDLLIEKLRMPISQANVLLSKMELEGSLQETLGLMRRT